MSRITDYGFLFQTTFGTSKTNLVNNIQLSQMNSSSVQNCCSFGTTEYC